MYDDSYIVYNMYDSYDVATMYVRITTYCQNDSMMSSSSSSSLRWLLFSPPRAVAVP